MMRKAISLFVFLASVMLLSATVAAAAPDNFNGIGYTSTYEQYPDFIRGVPIPDGKPSAEEEREYARTALSFHRGAEKVAGLPVGSVFYIFDNETNLFSSLSFCVNFYNEAKSLKVESVDYSLNKQPYYRVIAPLGEADRYFSSIYDYFVKEYGEPSEKKDKNSAAWTLFDPGVHIHLYLADAFGKDKALWLNILKMDFPPEAEIFL